MSLDSPHIVIVNAIYPPDKGASGTAVKQLEQELKEVGFHTTIVTTDKTYKPDLRYETVIDNIIRVKSKVNKDTYLKRLYAAHYDSKAIFKQCAQISADAFIICTDPPLMNYLAPIYLKDKKYLIWAMDLYPEAFVAKGLVSDRNWIVKKYRKRLQNSNSKGWIALGQQQLDFLTRKFKRNSSKGIVIPCGIQEAHLKSLEPPVWKEKEKITFAYSGNLGEAHSVEFMIELISKSDPKKHHFVLSCFGAKAKALYDQVSLLAHVSIVDWIEENEMGHIDIQIVSLKKEWTHVCVPSKAVSAICYETPILFHGSKKGDTYQHFQNALWHVNDGPSTSLDIDQFYASLHREEVEKKKENSSHEAKAIKEKYKRGVQELCKYLMNG